jgi:hypothetical protein
MSRARQTSKRKGRSKAVPVLGAAGLSLTLASAASLAKPVPSFDTMTRNAGESREIVLHEEEIVDPSLATFHVFDKERTGPFRSGDRRIAFGGACCQFACLGGQSGTGSEGQSPPAAFSPQPRPTRPWHKNAKKRY